MEYKVEQFNRKGVRCISLVEAWWKERTGVEFVNHDMFADYGFMVYGDDEPIAAVFIYPTIGCNSILIGYPISDPLILKESRQKALEILINHAEKQSKELNYNYVVSYAGSKGAVDLLTRSGYLKGDENVINFIKKI